MIILKFDSNVISQSLIMHDYGLGYFKMFSPVDSINKYLDKKIILPTDDDKHFVGERDTVTRIYKNALVRLIFNYYYNNLEKKQETQLVNIYCEDRNLKATNGIKIGEGKIELLKKLDHDQFWMDRDKTKGKGHSIVTRMGTSGNINYRFYNNVLYALEVDYAED